VLVDTLGITGARITNHLFWSDALYREHLARRRPDLVVLSYGTNEAGDDDTPPERYEADVRAVVARVRETVPGASCLLVGPTDRPFYDRRRRTVEDRPRTAVVIDVMRRVAEESGCGFFDTQAFMGGPLSMVDWVAAEPPLATPDHVHLTRRGYERWAQVALDAMMRGYGELPVSPLVASTAGGAAPGAVAGAAQAPSP
jgi:lysophospholipase L1-like esterase